MYPTSRRSSAPESARQNVSSRRSFKLDPAGIDVLLDKPRAHQIWDGKMQRLKQRQLNRGRASNREVRCKSRVRKLPGRALVRTNRVTVRPRHTHRRRRAAAPASRLSNEKEPGRPDRSGLFTRNQGALGVSSHTCDRHLVEFRASCQVYQKRLVISNGCLRILLSFDVSVAAPMRERPSSTKFYMLYAKKGQMHNAAISKNTKAFHKII